MATKKQSDYLNSLLTDDNDQGDQNAKAASRVASNSSINDDRQTGRAGLSLLGRENALARVANGEVRQVTQLLLDPSRVRIWEGNARLQSKLSETTTRDLIDSIIAEGGQKVPALVRHIKNNSDYDYELIVGTRRHFAISWLKANNYPEMRLLAQVADIDDEAAFRLADLENRARQDVSVMERAQNYAEALNRHYGGKAVRMAERMNVSKGWLSKMLKITAIPQEILTLFADLHELSLNAAYKLATAMEDSQRATAILAQAKTIANEQASEGPASSLTAAAILNLLMSAHPPRNQEPIDYALDITHHNGRPILSVKSVNRQGVTVHLPAASGATDDDLMAALKTALDHLRSKGVALQ